MRYLEPGLIQQSIDNSNNIRLIHLHNVETIFIPNFSYDIIRNWEFFDEYINGKPQFQIQ